MVDVKRQMKRLARNAAKDYGLGWRVPRAYLEEIASAVDDRKVLFLESSLDVLPEAFKVLYGRLLADSRFDVEFVTLRKHKVSPREYLSNCEAFARNAATARFIFLCDASDVVSCLPLRRETKVVQLWHACGAFKKFGMSTTDLSFGLDRGDIERHPFYGNLSLVTVSSADVVWAYVEAMHLEGREDIVVPLGVSRTDLFFREDFHDQAFQNLYEAVPEALGKRVVLYAPTYRGTMGDAKAPALFDVDVIRKAIGADSVLLVKQHPMVRDAPYLPDGCEGFAFDVSGLQAIDELLVVADVLITDYSSVVFEYALFGRPMLFYAPDLSDYVHERDFYYRYDAMTPGPVLTDSAGLAESLSRVAAAFDRGRVDAFRRKFMSACDGHSTDRILAYLGCGR